jgi:acetyl-CoA C-acetyltransferase
MKEVFIVSASRTPMGSFGGILSGFSATQLGSFAIEGALKQAGVSAGQVQEVYMGNVVSGNLGQAPARQAALGAGISDQVPCTTINKVCSSGAKSVMIAAMQIGLGLSDIVVAGGMESMSNIPYYVPKARFGYKYGDATLVDGLAKDGLTDVYMGGPMGVFADRTAEKFGFSREDQDAYAIESYTRAAKATEQGAFKAEITPVEVPQRRGDALVLSEDEEFKKVKFEKIPGLRPAFSKDGTVTAANASTINDGAAALVLASEEAVKQYNLTPLARIASFADAAHEPEWFTTAPTKAAPIALERAGLGIKDIDYFEVNEAFSVVTMAFNKEMAPDPAKVNVNGGAVALGHPLGASGARILTTLTHALCSNGGKHGLPAICNGGGGASSIVIEKA